MKLNPNAAKNFNQKGEDLLNHLNVELIKPKKIIKKKTFIPDFHVSATIEPIGEIKISRSDPFGNETGKEFSHEGNKITIYGEQYQKLKQLAQSIQKTPDFRNSVSLKLLVDLIFEWIKEKYKQKVDSSIIDYVISECEKRLKDCEIWIPLACTRIESELEFGNITIKTITRGMIEQHESEIRKHLEENDFRIEAHFEKERKELLGFAAATLKIVAEPRRAYEIAIEETEKSVALLRCLYCLNCSPFYVSYSVPLGQENLKSYRYFLVKDNKITFTSSGGERSNLTEWRIDDESVKLMRSFGLEKLSDLIKKNKKTSFQTDVMNALLLYARSSLQNELSDKLTYILTPLEAILLLNPQGFNTQDLAERLVLLVDKDLEGRKHALDIINKIYNLRLKFVYGEYKDDDVKVLEEFMTIAWTFFVNLVAYSDVYLTKEEFIKSIDNLKFSGGRENV